MNTIVRRKPARILKIGSRGTESSCKRKLQLVYLPCRSACYFEKDDPVAK